MAKKLTKVERFLLQNEGANYRSCRCPKHGIVQAPKGEHALNICPWEGCEETVEFIHDAKAYAAAN